MPTLPSYLQSHSVQQVPAQVSLTIVMLFGQFPVVDDIIGKLLKLLHRDSLTHAESLNHNTAREHLAQNFS